MRPQLARLAADRDARRLVPHGMQPERARPPALRLGDVFAGHVDEQHAERARAKCTEPREAPARAATEQHEEPKADASDARIACVQGRQHQGAKACETRGACEDEEGREEPVVVLSHAGAHPGAVMIEAQEAALAEVAVARARRAPDRARVTPAVLDVVDLAPKAPHSSRSSHTFVLDVLYFELCRSHLGSDHTRVDAVREREEDDRAGRERPLQRFKRRARAVKLSAAKLRIDDHGAADAYGYRQAKGYKERPREPHKSSS